MPLLDFNSRFPWLTFGLLVTCVVIAIALLMQLPAPRFFMLFCWIAGFGLLLDFFYRHRTSTNFRLQGLLSLSIKSPVADDWEHVLLLARTRAFGYFILLEYQLSSGLQSRRYYCLIERWTLPSPAWRRLQAYLHYQRCLGR